MMTRQVFAQAALLAGQLEEEKMELLKVLCQAAAASLKARLKENVTMEDCRSDFLMAASLGALAALRETEDGMEEFRVGDLTVKQGGRSGADGLRKQAEQIMAPWLKDSFAFLGV